MPDSLPAIIIVAFNRPHALQRLLQAVVQADFSGYQDIPFVISIDQPDCKEVTHIAKNFMWPFGKKRLIIHQQRLGLRKHILACGDLTREYQAVIILEDDLFVSPAFYDYAVKAMEFYADADEIAGISLYAYNFNEHARLNFFPLHDGYDNYFMQTPSSWGQLWTQKQWNGFQQWWSAAADRTIGKDDFLPEAMINWPDSSWKKYFAKYLVQEQKYILYPRTSLSTNMGDAGTHSGRTLNHQVVLAARRTPYHFSTLRESLSIYDAYYEIKAEPLQLLNPTLQDFHFECDLYGMKQLHQIRAPYLISIRHSARPIYSYDLGLLPHELNIVYNISGDFFHLSKVEDLNDHITRKRLKQMGALHKNQGVKRYALLFALEAWNRFNSRR